jgi:predicted Zn-dependent protease
VVLFAWIAAAQTPTNPSCAITPVTANRDLPNMFSAVQEGDLGEVLAQVVQDNAYELDEPELAAYLQQLGDRLASHLPPLGLKFRFYLSNVPVANAFSIAGGRIYVTRKLIGFAHSEDELAGVMAHELGHIVTHQTAIDYTRFLKSIGINEVSELCPWWNITAGRCIRSRGRTFCPRTSKPRKTRYVPRPCGASASVTG